MRHAPLLADLRGPRGQQPVASHREEDARLAVLEHQQDRGERHHGAERHDPARRLQPGDVERLGQRIRRPQFRDTARARSPRRRRSRRSPCRWRARRGCRSACCAADYASLPRPSRSRRTRCRRRRRSPRPDGCLATRSARTARSSPYRCASPRRRRRSPSTSELDHDHDVVRARALLDAEQENPRDDHHDRKRRDVDEYRHAGEPRRRVHQRLHRRIRAERDGPIAVRDHPGRLMPTPVSSELK